MYFKLAVGFLIALAIFLLMRRYAKKQRIKPIKSRVLLNSKYKKLAPYIEAQARHETGNYSSRAYLQLFNLFGMKHANKRKQLGKDTGDVYRKYESNEESIKDLLLYFDAVNFPKEVASPTEYVRQLKLRNYFTDRESNYLSGVEFHINNIA